jgi:hypothetical protein
MPEATTDPAPPYDRDAIYHPNGPFNPSFMREAVRALFRTLPIDPKEPKGWADRRMNSALLGLSALHPRDEIEVMLGVQAMSAYHAAAAGFRIGMNLIGGPNGHSTRHITAACSAARVFDTMLRALERRQAKPLTAPTGRPAPRIWDDAPNPTAVIKYWEEAVLADAEPPKPPGQPERTAVWTPEAIAAVHALRERTRIEKENEGLDIANTEGILPGGGMILMEEPTPQQAAYMGRRLGLMYKREIEENRRNGITKMPKIRGIRPGDLIP